MEHNVELRAKELTKRWWTIYEESLRIKEEQERKEREELEAYERSIPRYVDLTVDAYYDQTMAAMKDLEPLPVTLNLKKLDNAWAVYSEFVGRNRGRSRVYCFDSIEQAEYAHGPSWRGFKADTAPFGKVMEAGPDSFVGRGIIVVLRDGVVVDWGHMVSLLRMENFVFGLQPTTEYVTEYDRMETFLHPIEEFPLAWVERLGKRRGWERVANWSEESLRATYFNHYARTTLAKVFKMKGNTLSWAVEQTAAGRNPLEVLRSMLAVAPMELTAEELLAGTWEEKP